MTDRATTMIAVAAVAGSMALGGGALAQQAQPAQNANQPKQQQQQQQSARPDQQSASPDQGSAVTVLSGWNYQALYDKGWSARRILDADVTGAGGDDIGDVENIVISDQGKVLAVIAEVGGFWDIGDTHVAVPWEQVDVGSYDEISIPVTEETVEDYSLFQTSYFTRQQAAMTRQVDDDLDTGPNVWKATDLLDDYAVLQTGEGYGYVTDLIFEGDQLKSVVVNPGTGYGTYGPRAYPWGGYGTAWRPGDDRYRMPYQPQELAEIDPFDYDELQDDVF